MLLYINHIVVDSMNLFIYYQQFRVAYLLQIFPYLVEVNNSNNSWAYLGLFNRIIFRQIAKGSFSYDDNRIITECVLRQMCSELF